MRTALLQTTIAVAAPALSTTTLALTTVTAITAASVALTAASVAIAAAAIAAAASRSLNELAVAGVRAMLGFECRRAVVQEPRARHSAMQQQQQKLICWRRRSSWQFEAGVDDPHTVRKISRRPFSTCRTSRPNLEAEHASSAVYLSITLPSLWDD